MELKLEKLSEEFKKDIYHPNFLEKFKIPSRTADISAVIPTYNRCPFDKNSENYQYNPLAICVRTLLLQKSPLKEIIIVDDASTDNTANVVKELRQEAYKKKGIEIKCFHNKERKGSSISRNIGAKHASGKYLFFLDDDCVPAPYLTFIANIVLKKIEEQDTHFAVLVLPVYDRASLPTTTININDLTRSFFKREGLSARFNTFPAEYLKIKDKFLNTNLKIFNPIKVYQTWGHFIIERSKYLDVGGFPDFATWPNKAGEEQEFASRLIENTYSLYYLPGTKAASYHGAFGAKIGKFNGIDWLAEMTNNKLSLIRYSKICENGIISGNRVGIKDYLYSKIIAAFCIIYKRNMKEAINYARLSHKEFVVETKKSWFTGYSMEVIADRSEREMIWHKAIEDGLNLLLETEIKKTKKLKGFISSFRVKERLGEIEERESRIKKLFEEIYGE
ncbi:MAG: glycosyltransferase [Nanoarchaeota archaeon]|nr:glycosyltransferase [Nanoarchaeota archaeon]